MKVTGVEEFGAFHVLFRYCRPVLNDYLVYEVDAGEPTDYNLVIKASQFEGTKPVGEPHTLIIAKEWVLENLEAILNTVDVSA